MLLVACKGNENPKGLPESFYTQTTDTKDGKTKKVQKTNNNPMEQPAKMNGVPEVILKRTGYIVSYNTKTNIPNWVAWHLTAEHTSGSVERHHEVFHEDTDAPTPRVTDEDYFNSGFDRGHMCPAGDNKWDRKAMNETFLFTNICPQVHALNEGAWNDLELACRRWARKYGDVYIVCGPLLDDGRHRTIGRRRVVVPERFFKVVLAMDGNPKAIGFIYDNNGRNSEKMFSHATTVDEVERLTGIDFFPQLDDKIEDVVEATRGYF
jgi:endonuclease G